MSKKEISFTEGPVFQSLLRFAIPVLGALLLQAAYGAVDLLIVGKFGNASSISAVGTGSSFMQMATFIITSLAMGSTVIIGHHIGEQKPKEAGNAVGTTIILFLIIAVIMTFVLEFAAGGIAHLLQAPAESFDKTILYIRICSAGIVIIIAYNVISGVLRGVGNANLPLLFVGIACVINILGDLLLVGVFHMDVVGAAIATVFAQFVSVVCSVVVLRKQDMPIEFSREQCRIYKEELGKILNVGVPIALQETTVQISFLVVNSVINQMGLMPSAGYGIAQKIVSFIMLVPSSIMQSVSAFVAQNIGAGKHDRARETLHYALLIAGGFGIFIAILIQFIASPVVGVFTSDQTVIAFGSQYICGYIFDCFFAGIHFCFSGYFCAYGKSGISFFHNIVAILCVRIPGAYLTSKWFPQTLFPMGIATACGSLLSALICVAAFVWLKQHKRLQNVQTADSTVRVSKKHRSDVR